MEQQMRAKAEREFKELEERVRRQEEDERKRKEGKDSFEGGGYYLCSEVEASCVVQKE